MLLHDLLDAVELRDHLLEVRGDTGPELGSIVHDSRQAAPGSLFCCIPGAQSDGHDFAPAAVSAGAVALLVERDLPLAVTQARVDSVRRVLGPLCARFHGYPSEALRVLGVTGTNGKTSTTYLLEAIARAHGDRAGVIGTVEARVDGTVVPLQHTTPEATDLQALLAQMRDRAVATVAMEVSSHALDQHRVDGTRFAAVTFTNLTHEHLDYHPTVDAYFAAKARLFDLQFAPRAAINIDDEYGRALREIAVGRGLEVCTYSAEDPTADVYARDVLLRRDGTMFDLVDARGDHHGVVRSPLVGRFNVANALAAAATALVVGLSFEAVLAGLGAPVRVPGRFERVGAARDFAVLVDYAHTPDALASVLGAARSLVDGGKLVVVFGCGGDRDRSKRPLMGEVATRLADVAILTSDNPRSEEPGAIARDVLEGIPVDRAAPIVELDRRAAIRAALRAAGVGDVVVIAGKGHETGQTAGGVTIPFDDRAVAVEELGGVPMTVLTAREIARRAAGVVIGDDGATVDAWAFDSRMLQPGACFVALRGDRDGHDFVEAAFDAGAHVALVDHDFAGLAEVAPGRALVHVGDTLGALQEIARSLRLDRPELQVVAVGGSTGKTSTKDLLAAALVSRGCHANEASYNNEFGLPITLCNAPGSAGVVVTEMGERFAGDLRELCDIARPDTGVITNVGLAHAEHLGGREGVVAVLAELLESLPGTGTAVLNVDDPATPELRATTLAAVVTVGQSAAADYCITDVSLDERLRPSFSLGGQRFTVPLHGTHQVLNAGMAVAVAHTVFSLSYEEIALELAQARPGRWRMELLETDTGVTVLNDAYNANPTSMEAALVALAGLPRPENARRVAVVGDMRELGSHHDDAHRAVGERAAALHLDVVVGVGAGGAAIAKAAGANGVDAYEVADAAAAVALVAPMVRAGDAVLVKASRALGLERVADGLVSAARAGCGTGDRP